MRSLYRRLRKFLSVEPPVSVHPYGEEPVGWRPPTPAETGDFIPVEMAPAVSQYGNPIPWDAPPKSTPITDMPNFADLTGDEIRERHKRYRFDSSHKR